MKRNMIIILVVIIGNLFAQGGGTCANLTGGDHWLDLGSNYKFDMFAIEMWVYKSNWNVSANEIIISCTQSGGYNVRIIDDAGGDELTFSYRNSDKTGYEAIVYPVSNLTDGWHHIAVWVEGQGEMFVDGISVGTGAGSVLDPEWYDPDNFLLIGAEASGGTTPTGEYFNGYIDEIRFWNDYDEANLNVWKHLPITSLQRPADHTQLKGYYKMDTSSGGGWLDDAANNVTTGSEVDLTNHSATTIASSAPIGNFPEGYTYDAEALWLATGASFSRNSNGLSIRDYNYTNDNMAVDESFCFANNGLTGVTAINCPAGVDARSNKIWYIDKNSSDYIEIKIDLSDCGASSMNGSSISTDYKLLKRTTTSGDFTLIDTGESKSGDQILFNLALTGDGYYTIGINALINFSKHTIKGDFDGANSVHATDIDNDGDIDVLGTAGAADDITWFENDGNNNFSEHTIRGNFAGANSVYASDIDGDGDMDILGSAYSGDDIKWFENGGIGNFTVHEIKGDFNGANSVYASDIDGDGNMDVLGTAYEADDITWWKNDGNENFTQHTIKGDFNGARSVHATDIDNDGDMDVLGIAGLADDITWFENDGNNNFIEHTIKGDFDNVTSVYAADIDSDGDMDVVGSAYSAGDITWFENDGSGSFVEHIIDGNYNYASSVYAADLDGDGDMDVLASCSEGEVANDLKWYENDGNENFVEYIIQKDYDGSSSVFAKDIDKNGAIDILCTARYIDDISWWESNRTIYKTTTFTDGSSFTPVITIGQEKQVIGRFQLNSSEVFGLISAKIKLKGIRTGFSDFRLWISDDDIFNGTSDIQLGCMVKADPEDGNFVLFDKGYSAAINTSGSFFFLTCDVAPDATGSIQPLLINNSSLEFSGGSLDDTIYYSTLSTLKSPDTIRGNALEFDGINNFIDLGRPSNLKLTNFTLSCWFKRLGDGRTSNTGAGGIIAEPLITKGRGEADGDWRDMNYFLGIRPTDNLLVADFEDMTDGSNHPVIGVTAINNDEWYHATVTYDGTSWRLYLNGNLEIEQTENVVPRYDSIQDNAIGSALNSSGVPDGHFKGLIEEVQIWNIARTTEEIRESINLPLTGAKIGLVGYWQMNEEIGNIAIDNYGVNDGVLSNMDDSDWVDSTIPFGTGSVNTQIISSIGVVDFAESDVSMNITAKTGTDTLVVTKIEHNPNIDPAFVQTAFNSQYWVIRKYGAGSLTTDISLTISEDLTLTDENNPNLIKLYTRESNSDGSWSYNVSATSLNAGTNTAIFTGITDFSQLIIAKHEVSIPQNITTTISEGNFQLSWEAVPDAISYIVYSSDDPYGTFEEATGTFDGLSWSQPYTSKMFYYVVAVDGAKKGDVETPIHRISK